MIQRNGLNKISQKPSNAFLRLIFSTIACLVFLFMFSAPLHAQDGYDIYYDSVDQWLIMAYTEYNASSGKYEVYLEVMDANGNLVPHENIKGLTGNPYLIANNAKNPIVALAFDSTTGTAYVEYETDAGLVSPVSISEIATAKYSLSGAVRTSTGTAISSVTMSLTGTSTGSTPTDSIGNYSFANLINGSYTVTPTKTGCTFSPTSRPVTISGANVTGQDFTGTCVTGYTISGKVVTSKGAALAGATMTLSGAKSATTSTDSSGNYSFTGLANGSYTVKVTKTGYAFSPSSKTATISGSNVTLNFNSYYP